MKRGIAGLFVLSSFVSFSQETSWIRINQLGYPTLGSKVAVWCSKPSAVIQSFSVIDAVTKKSVYTGKAGKPYGPYGPFTETYRLNFSAFKTPGRYFLQTGNTRSPEFSIGDDVYKGAADFCLRYMRQQRF
jgi:endoglucanase